MQQTCTKRESPNPLELERTDFCSLLFRMLFHHHSVKVPEKIPLAQYGSRGLPHQPCTLLLRNCLLDFQAAAWFVHTRVKLVSIHLYKRGTCAHNFQGCAQRQPPCLLESLFKAQFEHVYRIYMSKYLHVLYSSSRIRSHLVFCIRGRLI